MLTTFMPSTPYVLTKSNSLSKMSGVSKNFNLETSLDVNTKKLKSNRAVPL